MTRTLLSFIPKSLKRSGADVPVPNWLERRPGLDDSFLESLVADPVHVYAGLWKRASRKRDFEFRELEGTFKRIQTHIGQLHDQYEELDPDHYKEVLDDLMKRATALIEDGLPYLQAMSFVSKWVDVLDYIAFRTRTQPTIELLIPGDGSEGTRFSIDDADQWDEIQRAFRKSQTNYKGGVNVSIYKSSENIRTVANGMHSYDDRRNKLLEPLLEQSQVVLFPTYKSLDTAFFTKIRQVPVFVLGLLEVGKEDANANANADGRRMSPLHFYKHDAQHSDALWKGLSERVEDLKAKTKFFERSPSRVSMYSVWQQNAEKLRELVDSKSDNGPLHRAMNIILFDVLHESQKGVLERETIASRLDHRGNKRILDFRYARGDFGEVDSRVSDQFDEARRQFKQLELSNYVEARSQSTQQEPSDAS